MKKLWIVFFVICLAGCGSGKKSKAEQLEALDKAYKSGVFNKEEYDAKKAAVDGPAAAPSSSAAPAPVAGGAPAASAPLPVSPESEVGAPAAAIPLPPTPAQAPPQAAVPQPVTPVAPSAPAAPKSAPAPKPAPVAKTAEPEEADAEPAPSKGCEDAEYKSRRGGPQSRFFAAPVDQVRSAALSALAKLDFSVQKAGGNEIEATRRKRIIGSEQEVLLFQAAQQGGQKGTRVTAETKKGGKGKSWSAALLAQTACNLK